VHEVVNLVLGIVPAGSGPELARAPIGSGPYGVRLSPTASFDVLRNVSRRPAR